MMIIRKSPFSGQTNMMEIPVTPAQLDDWNSGTLIQNAMPNLTPEQREFIKTGITPAEWEVVFGEKL